MENGRKPKDNFIWEEVGNITAEQLEEMRLFMEEYKKKHPNLFQGNVWYQGTINGNLFEVDKDGK